MKNLSFLFLFILATNDVTAQKGAVKGGLSVLYNQYTSSTGIGGGLTFEYRVGKKFTFAGALDYTRGNAELVESDRFLSYATDPIYAELFQPYKSTVWSFRPEFRFYPKAAMKGFFLGAGVGFGTFNYAKITGLNGNTIPLATGNETLFYPALMMGLNIQPTPNFCIEISVGGGAYILYQEFAIPVALRAGYSF